MAERAPDDEPEIAIHTNAGYQKLLVWPGSIRIDERALTAQVMEDPGRPAFDALMRAWYDDRRTMFRVGGAEVECWVVLGKSPTLSPRQPMLRYIELYRTAPADGA